MELAVLDLADVIELGARRWPDRVAITSPPRTVSYSGLLQGARRTAGALERAGVGRQDRVCYLAGNRVDFFEVLLGGAYLGAVTVPVNWRLSPREADELVADADPTVVIVEPELASLVPAALKRLGPERVLRLAPDGEAGGDLAGAVAQVDPGIAPARRARPGDVMWMLYTSGTTGKPKGVEITHRNFCGMLDGLTDAWEFRDGSQVYVPYPNFHGVGAAWPLWTLHRGGTVHLRRAFDPADLLETVSRERISLVMMVPAVLHTTLSNPAAATADLSSLRTVVYGAAPITQALLDRAIARMPSCGFVHAYGSTESTGTITTMSWAEHRTGTERMRSCGLPLPWVELRVVEPVIGTEVGPRRVGEVVVRGDMVMRGYFRNPTATAEAVDPDGWLHTGDAGYLDEQGYLYLTDRVKDMIITGGENVYPAEVENVLADHPGVAEVAVIGVPDERWGERVHAVVVPAEGAELDGPALVAWSRERLARYKSPGSVEVRREPLPLNPAGKVLRRVLREQAATRR